MGVVKTSRSSRGRSTNPSSLRKKRSVSQAGWQLNPDGTARVSPAPPIMSLLGSAADGRARDAREKKKARQALGRNAANE